MKKTNIFLGLLIILAIIIGFNLNAEIRQKTSAIEFVKELEKLGYYKYTDQEDIELLKKEFIENFDPNNRLTSMLDENTGVPLDLRNYLSDSEVLYERGGFADLLEQVEPTFKKIGLKFDIKNHQEEWDPKNKWLNHEITINNTEYPIFEDYRGSKKRGWDKAIMRFAQIINDQAKKQSIDERIYLTSSGNDSRLVFLTDDLHDYINSVFPNKNSKPLEVSEWMKMMNITPKK